MLSLCVHVGWLSGLSLTLSISICRCELNIVCALLSFTFYIFRSAVYFVFFPFSSFISFFFLFILAKPNGVRDVCAWYILLSLARSFVHFDWPDWNWLECAFATSAQQNHLCAMSECANDFFFFLSFCNIFSAMLNTIMYVHLFLVFMMLACNFN